MTQKWKTIGIMAALALGSIGLVGLIFAPLIHRAEEEIRRHAGTLAEYRELMKRKESFEAEWNVKKNYMSQGIPAEEVLNSWQKALMGYAQAESLTLNKLEPAGMKDKEASVFLSFQGDMKQLVRFIYHLMDSEPLATIQSFSLRQEEGSKEFSFEMMLGKAT